MLSRTLLLILAFAVSALALHSATLPAGLRRADVRDGTAECYDKNADVSGATSNASQSCADIAAWCNNDNAGLKSVAVDNCPVTCQICVPVTVAPTTAAPTTLAPTLDCGFVDGTNQQATESSSGAATSCTALKPWCTVQIPHSET